MSMMQMIFGTDIFTNVIMGTLIIFSFVSWGIVLNRFFALASVRRMNRSFTESFHLMRSVVDITRAPENQQRSPIGRLGMVGVQEHDRILADAKQHKSGITDWSFYLQNQFFMAQEALEAESGRLARKQDMGIFFLAIFSSVAPFLGLLGTVWGIMVAFMAIGEQGSASLATVAPGIAAALVTTIAGLVVAIPSTFFYNIFIHTVERIQDELDEFSDRFMLRLKQELFNLLYASKDGGVK